MLRTFKSKTVALYALLALTVSVLVGCGKVDFKVDFVVDDTVIHTVNTTGSEVIRMPDNPVKEGYEFKGWFWDKDSWQQPFTGNSLLDTPLTGDMKVYAKFEKVGTTAIETLPIPGTAYHLFIDQENVGKRYYLDGTVNGYHLGATEDLDDALNVYVEEAGIAGKYNLFCVKGNERLYINIVQSGTFYNAVFNNSPITAYDYDLTLKTFIGTIDGNKLLLGTNSTLDYARIGTRYLNEPSFISHLIVSQTPDEQIPEISATETNITGAISGPLGIYKVTGTVIGVNAQSFLIKDNTGAMLVYMGSGWSSELKVGDVVTVEGQTNVYAGAKQFAKGAEYVKADSETVSHPTPDELTAAELDNIASAESVTIRYVKITGILSMSGTYYNLTVNGAQSMGSITYPVAEDAVALAALNGKTVEVVGYFTGVTGTETQKYANVLAISITEVTAPDDGNTSSGGGNEGGETPDEPEVPDTPDNPEIPDKPAATEATIAEIISGELGNYKTTGVVVGYNSQSFVLKDDSGMILVYLGNTWAPDVTFGDVVTVEGETSVHGGAKQFGKNSVYTKSDNAGFTPPTDFRELTAAEIDAYATAASVSIELVKLTGTLAISGSYFNVNIDGCAVIGSITYPIAELVSILAEYDGKQISVYGYVTGVTGNGKFLNVMTMGVQLVEPEGGETPEEPGTPTIPETPTDPEIPDITDMSFHFGFVASSGIQYLDGTNTGGKEFRWSYTSDEASAAVFYLEQAGENGFYIYFMRDGVKTYMNIVENGSYVNLLAGTEPLSVWIPNDDIEAFVVDVNGTLYVPKNYGGFNNVEARAIDYVNGETYVVTVFPVESGEDGDNVEGGETPDLPDITGLACYLCYQDANGIIWYLDGTNAGGKEFRWSITSDANAAATFYMEDAGEGSYYFYFMRDGVKTYMNIVENGSYVNLLAGDTAISKWLINYDIEAFVVDVNGTLYVPKNYGGFNNVEARAIDYVNGETYVVTVYFE